MKSSSSSPLRNFCPLSLSTGRAIIPAAAVAVSRAPARQAIRASQLIPRILPSSFVIAQAFATRPQPAGELVRFLLSWKISLGTLQI